LLALYVCHIYGATHDHRAMAEEDFIAKCKRFRVLVLKEIYDTEETFTRKIEFVVQVSNSVVFLFQHMCSTSAFKRRTSVL